MDQDDKVLFIITKVYFQASIYGSRFYSINNELLKKKYLFFLTESSSVAVKSLKEECMLQEMNSSQSRTDEETSHGMEEPPKVENDSLTLYYLSFLSHQTLFFFFFSIKVLKVKIRINF